MSEFCKLCMNGDTFIAKTCPRTNCEFNIGHNNKDKNKDKNKNGGKKDVQIKYSI